MNQELQDGHVHEEILLTEKRWLEARSQRLDVLINGIWENVYEYEAQASQEKDRVQARVYKTKADDLREQAEGLVKEFNGVQQARGEIARSLQALKNGTAFQPTNHFGEGSDEQAHPPYQPPEEHNFQADLLMPPQAPMVTVPSHQSPAMAQLQINSQPAPHPHQQVIRDPYPAQSTIQPVNTPSSYSDHQSGVSALAWSPDGKYIASGDISGQVKVWNATTRETVYTKEHGVTSGVSALAWSPQLGANLLISASINVMMWQGLTGERLFIYKLGPHVVTSLAWSFDGQQIALTSNKRVHIWKGAAFKERCPPYEGHMTGVSSVSWSPHGDHLVSGGGDYKDIHVWEAAQGTTLQIYKHNAACKEPDVVTCVAWSPQGAWIASASGSLTKGRVELWEAETGKLLQVREHYTKMVTCIAWSPIGRLIASGSEDGTIHVWDATSGQEVKVFTRHLGEVKALAWSPDGTRIASASLVACHKGFDSSSLLVYPGG